MTKWKLATLAADQYAEPWPTVNTRTDALDTILGVNGIIPLDKDTLDDINARNTATDEATDQYGKAIVALTCATWKILGDDSLGVVELEQWIPLLEAATETIHESTIKEAGSTTSSRLFAALVGIARNPKNTIEYPEFTAKEYDTVVPAAVLFAGAGLQYVASRHPHAPRIKPGGKIPEKVQSLARDLADQIDLSLANGAE